MMRNLAFVAAAFLVFATFAATASPSLTANALAENALATNAISANVLATDGASSNALDSNGLALNAAAPTSPLRLCLKDAPQPYGICAVPIITGP